MRVYNFSAGPAVLPESVLKRAQDELMCLPGAGASVLEISHRSKEFISIIESASTNLRQLLQVPDTYEILFLQGGSRLQFSMVPMNLLLPEGSADYIVTGSWGKYAYKEAVKEGTIKLAFDGAEDDYRYVPTDDQLQLDPKADYVYYTSNETIGGVQFSTEPDVGDVPLICDASSDFLHRPLDISKYGLIYACAQKNAGPAGVTIVIVRKELLERSRDQLPGYCNYKSHADKESMFNTPPTFAIYLVDLVAQWLKKEVGGLDVIHQHNQEKASMLYDVIDKSDGFYAGHARADSRSLMNVTFRLPNDEIQSRFLDEAAKQQLCNLKGHRSVGGIRASIYNAMPTDGVEKLRDFMTSFMKTQA